MAPSAKDGQDGSPRFPSGGTVDWSGTGYENTGTKVKFEYIFNLIVDISVEEILIDFLYGQDAYGMLFERVA